MGDIKHRKAEIILIEDVENNRKVMATELENVGYHVDSVARGDKALELIKNSPELYRLALIDIMLDNEADGGQVAEEIRKINPKIQILFITGFFRDEMITERVLNRNFSKAQIYPKPINDEGWDQIFSAIGRIISDGLPSPALLTGPKTISFVESRSLKLGFLSLFFGTFLSVFLLARGTVLGLSILALTMSLFTLFFYSFQREVNVSFVSPKNLMIITVGFLAICFATINLGLS